MVLFASWSIHTGVMRHDSWALNEKEQLILWSTSLESLGEFSLQVMLLSEIKIFTNIRRQLKLLSES